MKEIILKVEGMQCGMCESHVNDAVRKAANVKKVTSSHVEGKTVVVCDESIDAQIVKNAIQKDGYNVSEVVEKPYVKKGLFSFFEKVKGEKPSSKRSGFLFDIIYCHTSSMVL